MKLDFYPVITADGRMTQIPRGGDTFKMITEHVGSPFDVCPITPDHKVDAYIDDEGIINDLPVNTPILLTFGVVLCGPVLLAGHTSGGNTVTPTIPDREWQFLQQVCATIGQALDHVAAVQANPGPHIEILTEERMKEIFGG